MRNIILAILFVFLSSSSFSQLQFPKDFKLIKGDNGAGDDDIYTNGRYSFDTHKLFREYDNYKGNDDSVKNYMSEFFGFPFHLTKDGLCWGTGKYEGSYSYVVVTSGAELFELYSKYNDTGFSFYSGWLLSTIREYKKEGKDPYFPMRFGN
ncbi:MAG: hypothetical protein WDM71_04720 [Ferruginibacter sp.]